MKESPQTSLLDNESQAAPKKTSGLYSSRFMMVTGILGVACLIAAIVLTIVGVVGLRNYGFDNNSFIAGIVLFGVGGALITVSCSILCGCK